jgi:hypothetical protein
MRQLFMAIGLALVLFVLPQTAQAQVDQVGKNDTATVGFWANKNGQALLSTYTATGTSSIGTCLASTYPNLFGNLSGATGSQVAAYFLKAKHASGTLIGNTYAQALATALNVWVTTTGLGWNKTATGPQHYGFQQACLGGLCYNMGNNGASFGVDNHTMQTVSYCLCCLNCMTTASADGSLTNLPTTLYFYNNDTTLTNGANIVLNGINESGDIN